MYGRDGLGEVFEGYEESDARDDGHVAGFLNV